MQVIIVNSKGDLARRHFEDNSGSENDFLPPFVNEKKKKKELLLFQIAFIIFPYINLKVLPRLFSPFCLPFFLCMEFFTSLNN
jgi:hypothetical protein